jgi:integrase
MQDHVNPFPIAAARSPWNKGKLTGAKPPLQPKHVWAIRTKLQVEGRPRDLAMFNLAIDSKLRGCDVVALKVENVAPSGYAVDRATVRQKKTGQPVRFELTEQTRDAVDDYLKAAGKQPGEFLFSGRHGPGRSMSTRQYARLVCGWIASIPLWYPLPETNKSSTDLPPHRQLESRAASAWPHQDRKHHQIPRHRGR